jgi:hypothetical protein
MQFLQKNKGVITKEMINLLIPYCEAVLGKGTVTSLLGPNNNILA